MPTRRRANSTADLFASLPPPSEVPVRRAARRGDGEQKVPASQPRLLLPKNLAGALERLGDAEVEALLAAVTVETKRRGRLPSGSAGVEPTALAKVQPRRLAADGATGALTTGKLNAVRAAFKAGVRPSVIARQFGISQSDVKSALAAEGRRGGR